MFDIGGPEAIALLVLGLTLLGPRRLVTVARQAGQFAGEARRIYREAVGTLERDIGAEELRESIDDIRGRPRPKPHRPVKRLEPASEAEARSEAPKPEPAEGSTPRGRKPAAAPSPDEQPPAAEQPEDAERSAEEPRSAAGGEQTGR